MGALLPGPTPSRKRPGASCAMASQYSTKESGWRGQVSTMAVPSLMVRVHMAAAASMLGVSRRMLLSAVLGLPVVIHTA